LPYPYNLKRRYTIKMMPSIQVEMYQLEERQPCPFNSRGGFNNTTTTSSLQDKAVAGDSAAEWASAFNPEKSPSINKICVNRRSSATASISSN